MMEPPAAMLDKLEAMRKRGRFSHAVPTRLVLFKADGAAERVVQVLDNWLGAPPPEMFRALAEFEQRVMAEQDASPGPVTPAAIGYVPPKAVSLASRSTAPSVRATPPDAPAQAEEVRKLPHRPVGTLAPNSIIKYLKGTSAPPSAPPAAAVAPAPPKPAPRPSRAPSWTDDAFSQTPPSMSQSSSQQALVVRTYTYAMPPPSLSPTSALPATMDRHVLLWVRYGNCAGAGCLRLHDAWPVEYALRTARELGMGVVAVILAHEDVDGDSRAAVASRSALREIHAKLEGLNVAVLARHVPENAAHSFFALWTRAVPTHSIVAEDVGDKLAARVAKAAACPLVAVDSSRVVPWRSLPASASRAEMASRFKQGTGAVATPVVVAPTPRVTPLVPPAIITRREDWRAVDWLHVAEAFGEAAGLAVLRAGDDAAVLAHLCVGTLSSAMVAKRLPELARDWESSALAWTQQQQQQQDAPAQQQSPGRAMPGDIERGMTTDHEFNALQQRLLETGLLDLAEFKAWTARLARLCEDAKDYRATAVLLLSKHYVGGAAGALLLAL